MTSGVVVDPAQQHRLVADGDAGVGEPLAGASLGRELLGVIEVGVDEQRVVPASIANSSS